MYGSLFRGAAECWSASPREERKWMRGKGDRGASVTENRLGLAQSVEKVWKLKSIENVQTRDRRTENN